MKTFFTLTLLFFTLCQLIAQEDYMDIIARQTCECIENIPETEDREQFNMKLGLCMIEACWDYKEEINRDYGIDMDRIDVEGERLGQVIGVKIGMRCPELMLKITQKINTEEEETETKSIKGVITKVEDDTFVIFSIKEETGKISKYYWLTFFSSNMELSDKYMDLVDKSVIIDFEEMELFDPKIEQYRSFNVITGMTFEELK